MTPRILFTSSLFWCSERTARPVVQFAVVQPLGQSSQELRERSEAKPLLRAGHKDRVCGADGQPYHVLRSKT